MCSICFPFEPSDFSSRDSLWWILKVKYITIVLPHLVSRLHPRTTGIYFTDQDIVSFYIASMSIITKSKSVPIFSIYFSCHPFQHYFMVLKLWNFQTKFSVQTDLICECYVLHLTSQSQVKITFWQGALMNHEWQWKVCTYSNVLIWQLVALLIPMYRCYIESCWPHSCS